MLCTGLLERLSVSPLVQRLFNEELEVNSLAGVMKICLSQLKPGCKSQFLHVPGERADLKDIDIVFRYDNLLIALGTGSAEIIYDRKPQTDLRNSDALSTE